MAVERRLKDYRSASTKRVYDQVLGTTLRILCGVRDDVWRKRLLYEVPAVTGPLDGIQSAYGN
ncbi:MAG: hypothetical protein ABSB82_18610 [Terriglobia bacterium]